MRRFVISVIAAAATLAAVLAGGVAPAVAGGPTSVLAVNHEASLAAAAVTGSAAYDDLVVAVAAMDPPTGERKAPDDSARSSVRLTWLIHDRQPWRMDEIFIDGADVWLSTTMSLTGESTFEAVPVRHRARDAALLLRTLGSLGVIGKAPTTVEPGSVVAGENVVGERPDATRAVQTPTDAGSSRMAIGVAGLLGLAIGTAMSVALGRWRSVRRREGEPVTRGGHLPEELIPVGFSEDSAQRPGRRTTGAS